LLLLSKKTTWGHVALDSCLGAGHTQRTRGAWALHLAWALPSAHVALGLS